MQVKYIYIFLKFNFSSQKGETTNSSNIFLSFSKNGTSQAKIVRLYNPSNFFFLKKGTGEK